MRYLIFPGETGRDTELGGKGKSLAALTRAGLPVPAWCAVSPRADTEAAAEIAAALATFPARTLFAVRSSAAEEDGAALSFAGQLESYLFVPPADVLRAVAAVRQSARSKRVLAYRREHGLDTQPPLPAVIIQQMVNADTAGVAFSADPVGGRRGVALVSAVYGLGSALVSGESDADTFQVGRDGRILDRQIAAKRTAHRAAPGSAEGVRAEPVPDDLAHLPALTDEQVQAVAALARRAERFFGRPQDIEWAIAGGQLYLLQSRPITTLEALPDPDGALNLWDNSNIAESYAGITTPLTFSFARHVYEHVYRQFCRLLGVSATVITEHDPTFRRMLGLIRGRVYYNLLSWYRILALLPGFAANRRFMEQMMGVKEELPEDLLQAMGRRAGMRDRLQMLRMGGKLLSHLLALPGSVARFFRRLDAALAPTDPPLGAMRADELAAHFHRLERDLLMRWDAPLVNDFFAMIFYGLLRRCAETWCGDREGTLQNDLISGQGGMISAEPARRVREMAAAADPAFIGLLCTGSREETLQAMAAHPEFTQQYEAYLAKFGDRCLEELKLESLTLEDDPLPLLRAVGHLAGRPGEQARAGDDPRLRAERLVADRLRWRPLHRFVFGLILRQARARVRDRENLRFERTRVFGRVRRIFLELGRRLAADGLLEEARDIFYLEKDEIFGTVNGTATCTGLKALVALRQAEFARFREMPAPGDRFATRGVVHLGNAFRGEAAPAAGAAEQRQGIGCCPGVVQGRARVITDPRDAQLEPGAILVAERTDPGWILLFPAAKGVLVERGSLLSHSAIVAREMRIPTVVSLPGLTAWLKDGDLVELDGSTGVVRRLGEEARDAQ